MLKIKRSVVAFIITLGISFCALVPAAVALDSGISSVSGDITYLSTPPVSLELNELASDSQLFLFREAVNVTLPNRVTADITEPGFYVPDSIPVEDRTWSDLSVGQIPAGTRVDSYYLHFDNASYDFNAQDYFGCVGQIDVAGSIEFERPVLGIVLTSIKLNNSNDELAHPSVDYCEHTYRHFQGVNLIDGCGSDKFELSDDRLTLTVRNFTDIHHDNYRVMVEAE